MIDLIVGIVTVMAIGSLVLWIGLPSVRMSIELPKYRILQNDRLQKETKYYQIGRGGTGSSAGRPDRSFQS